jgi:hypothetical protein
VVTSKEVINQIKRQTANDLLVLPFMFVCFDSSAAHPSPAAVRISNITRCLLAWIDSLVHIEVHRFLNISNQKIKKNNILTFFFK